MTCLKLFVLILLVNSSTAWVVDAEEWTDYQSQANGTVTEPTVVEFTPEQQNLLDEFRAKMMPEITQDWMKTDDYLVRWLGYKNWNLPEAIKMFQASLAWRAAEKMDSIFDEDWSDMIDEYPYTNDTRDKFDRPIGTINIGPWNIRSASYSGKMPRLNRYLTKLLEEATRLVVKSQAEGKNVTQWKVLMNMDGFGLRQHACTSCLSFYQTFAQTYEAHYPQFADAIVLINTPATFRVVMTVIKPFLSGPTQELIKVYGRNEKVWREYLDREIDLDQRRPEFGGTKQDPPRGTKPQPGA